MIISATQVERWTPFDLRDDSGAPLPGAVTYLIQPPTRMTKARWRRDVAGAGAFQHGRDELVETLKRGVAEVVAERQQGHWLALIDEWDAAWRGFNELRQRADATAAAVEAAGTAFQAVSARMADFEEQIKAGYPPYARLLGANTFWMEVGPGLAARHFLVGWENLPLAFERRGGLVPEELLEQLEAIRPGDWPDIGWIALGLSAMTADDEKNSARASASGANPQGSRPVKQARGRSSARK